MTHTRILIGGIMILLLLILDTFYIGLFSTEKVSTHKIEKVYLERFLLLDNGEMIQMEDYRYVDYNTVYKKTYTHRHLIFPNFKPRVIIKYSLEAD